MKAETATSREEPINQAKSSSTLVKRAYNSRSDHAYPASVRGRDHDNLYADENSISCSCCRNGINGKDTPAQRNECSGGDAIDIVPSREREEVPVTSAADKNEFARAAERDSCDVASRTTSDEAAAKTMEWISQSARSLTFYHHRKARCPSRPCSSSATASLMREENDRVACGDSSGDKGKDSVSSSCHETFIDFDDGVAEDVVTSDRVRNRTWSSVEDAWTEMDALTAHQRNADSAWRCQYEESHPREEPTFDLLGSSCGHHCDGCSHRHYRRGDCFHPRRCCQRHDSSMNAERCETRGHTCDGRALHKSWCDPMQGETGRLYSVRHCYSKDSDTISAVRECKNEERENEKENDEDEDEDDDDDEVAVINHKDSMCILAEKYKAGRRCRAGRREDQATPRSADRTGKDECNKSLTSEIIDQPELLESASAAAHEESSVKYVCRAHCESCGTAIANTCNRGRRHVPSEIEYERLKAPLSDPATSQCCSMRAPCRRTF